MANVDYCAACGVEIPEGVQICRKCETTVKESRERNETQEQSGAFKAREAAAIIKQYCSERRERLGECGQCPIKDACLNIVPLWEV